MEVINYNELLDIRASSGVVKDYSRPTGAADTIEPPQVNEILLDMVRSDPVLWTALDLTVDMVTFNGFDLIGGNEQLIKKAKKVLHEDLDFDTVLKNIVWQMLIYGDAYLEIVRGKTSGEVKELHALESSEMSIKYDQHGEVEKYVQRPKGVTNPQNFIDFPAKKIIHFKMFDIGSRVYSYNSFEPLVKSYNTKVFANHFLQGLFRNLHPKMVYFLKNANKENRRLFIDNLIRAKTNPAMDIVGLGEAEVKLLQYDFNSGLMDILEYLRTDVLMTTRVPKAWLGISDGANRSTAESVVIPFETKVKNIQKIVATTTNRQLLPELNFETLTYEFNPVSLMEEKSIFQNAQVFSSLQIETGKEHPVITYLKDKGITLPTDAKIINQTEKDKDMFESRQRENEKTDTMDTEINRKGVSEAGGAKLETAKVAATV